MKLSKGWIAVIVIAIVCLSIFMWLKGGYNDMVTQSEAVEGQWAQVENVYQRRADLIPNLVNTVKGSAAHEKETLDAVISARAKATQITLNADDITPENLAQYQAAQDDLSRALGRLMMVSESYPDLKANKDFGALQVQLEGTENRIATERKKFNETVRTYNTLIRRFPKNLIASLFGFEKKGYFEAAEGAEQAPKVEF